VRKLSAWAQDFTDPSLPHPLLALPSQLPAIWETVSPGADHSSMTIIA
jgi:hypothetical protein